MADPSSSIRPKKLVLVVDDDPPIRELLQEFLCHHGYRVIAAGSGAEALAAVHEHAPDCVLIDFRLQDVSGAQLCTRIKETRDDMRIIAMSSEVGSHSRELISAAGAHDFLAKPFDLRSVLEKVAALV